MLIYINDNKKIWAHNPILTKQESQDYINGIDCLWIDGLVIEYPQHEENQTVEMYLNENNTIRYEIVDIPIESKVATLDDVNKNITETKEVATNTESTVLMTSEDALLLMEMLVQVDEKLETLLMTSKA